jgi:hypothetical protein
MSYINDEVFDQGLDWAIANGSRFDLCSQEPTTYVEATSTYTLGNKTGLTVGATQDGSVDGRRVIVPAISDGVSTATGTATHWALTDGASVLVAVGTVSNTSITSGVPFATTQASIVIRDPA